MLRKLKYILIVLPVVVCIFMPIQSLAKGIPPGKWWLMPGVAEKFDLKETEKKELNDLYIQSRRSLIDLKSTLHKERFELDVMLDKETLDEAAVMSQFKKLEAARAKISTERFEVLLKVRKILGHERYQKLKMSFREFRNKRKDRQLKQNRQIKP